MTSFPESSSPTHSSGSGSFVSSLATDPIPSSVPAGGAAQTENAPAETPSEMAPRVLLVDDNDAVRTTLAKVLTVSGFSVTQAQNVNDALKCIAAGTFEVLLSDLQMPGAGDGFTVVSAMRHSNPHTVTLVFSGYPDTDKAMSTILLQADEILVKPLDPKSLLLVIRERLQSVRSRSGSVSERVASILERDAEKTIADWNARVQHNRELMTIPLTFEQRTMHLPPLFATLVHRLRHPRVLEQQAPHSEAAHAHGRLRSKQGYSVAMVVEESRMLQVSIFQTLQNNLLTVDFSLLLIDVMAIADEVDSQLKQTMMGYVEASENSQALA
jgi:DNA-binding response OmpR family regulator